MTIQTSEFRALNSAFRGGYIRFTRKEEIIETGGSYLVFNTVHPNLSDLAFVQMPEDGYQEIVNAGNLDSLFGRPENRLP